MGGGGGGVGEKGVRARCDQNLLYSFVEFINNEQSPVHDESTINTMEGDEPELRVRRLFLRKGSLTCLTTAQQV